MGGAEGTCTHGLDWGERVVRGHTCRGTGWGAGHGGHTQTGEAVGGRVEGMRSGMIRARGAQGAQRGARVSRGGRWAGCSLVQLVSVHAV